LLWYFFFSVAADTGIAADDGRDEAGGKPGSRVETGRALPPDGCSRSVTGVMKTT
jgi:hypothetical protein